MNLFTLQYSITPLLHRLPRRRDAGAPRNLSRYHGRCRFGTGFFLGFRLGMIELPGVFFELFEAFGADAVGRANLEVLSEVLFQAHPAFALADFAAPGTYAQH